MRTTMLPVTDRARRVVQTADAERRRLGHPVLTSQHILWALLAEKVQLRRRSFQSCISTPYP